MGRLIPAGTGLPSHRLIGIQIEGGDSSLLEEIVEERPPVAAPATEGGADLMTSPGGEGPPPDPSLEL